MPLVSASSGNTLYYADGEWIDESSTETYPRADKEMESPTIES